MVKMHLARGIKSYCGIYPEEVTVWIRDVTCKNCLREAEKDLKIAKQKVE